MKANIRLFVPNTTEALDFEYGLVIHYMQNNESRKGHAIGLEYYELAEIEPVHNALDIVEQQTLTEATRNQSKIDGFTLDSHYTLSFDQRLNIKIPQEHVRQVWLWLHCKNSTEYPFLLEKTTDTEQQILSQQNQLLVRVWAHPDWIEYETQPLAQHQQALLSTLQQSLSVYFNQIEQANRQKVLVELNLKTIPIDEPNPTVVETVVDNQNPTVAETLPDNQNSTSDVQSISSQKKISRTAWIVVLCVIFTIALLSVAPLKEKFMFFNDEDLNGRSVAADYQQAEISKINNDISEIKEGLQELRGRANSSNTVLWVGLAMLFFVLLGVIGLVYKALENSLEVLRRKNATLESTIVQLRQKTNTIKIKQQQPDQPAGSLFDQRQGLADRLDLLEEQIRLLKPQPASAKNGLDPLDYPLMLQSELSISPQSVSKPLFSKQLDSIDADDRKLFQQAFSHWLSNSLTHQFTDFLSKELLAKINRLGCDIEFAKAGIGLNRMVIDRKPPGKTCMVGLTSANFSLMYCHEKTSQTDDTWLPDTWYEVSIDSPNAADEQTVHQLEELCR